MKELEEINEQIRADFEYQTNAKYQGLFKSLGMVVATRFYQFLDKLDFIKKQAFVHTADEEYLALHAGGLIERKGETFAEGVIVFYGDKGAIAPQGTIVKDDEAEYITKQDAVIDEKIYSGTVSVANGTGTVTIPSHGLTRCYAEVEGIGKEITVPSPDSIQFDAKELDDNTIVHISVGKSDPVHTVSIASGENTNRDRDTILSTVDSLDGVNNDAYVLEMKNGAGAENLEAYRERINQFLYKPQAPFSRSNIEFVVKDKLPNIIGVWAKTKSCGRVNVYIADESGHATDYDVQTARAEIEKILPPNLSIWDVSIQTPTVTQVSLQIRRLTPNNPKIKEEITKNLKYIFGTRTFETEINDEYVEGIIYKTTNGDMEVERFDHDFTTLPALENTMYKLGTVEYVDY